MPDTWIHARVDAAERDALDRIAETEQRTRSQMIRILLAEAVAARQTQTRSKP